MGRTKKVLLAFLAAVAVIAAASGVASCEKYFLPTLRLSQDTVLVNKAAQELSLVVNSNVFWSFDLEGSAKWLTVTPYGGEATATVRIAIDANDSGEERSLTLPVKSATLQRNLVIVQSADDGIPED